MLQQMAVLLFMAVFAFPNTARSQAAPNPTQQSVSTPQGNIRSSA